jgi:hypothetical protein
LDEVKVKKGVS